jgi:hypothetical protein
VPWNVDIVEGFVSLFALVVGGFNLGGATLLSYIDFVTIVSCNGACV